MTNEMIINAESMKLMKEGKIKPTGRMLKAELEDGTEIEIPEPEAIHTFRGWKDRGYVVRKGEKAVAKFKVWKYTTKKSKKKTDDEEEDGNCYMKLAFFFSSSQVEKVA